MGSSHRRKSAACPKFDMVWATSLANPSGEEGVISSFKWFLPAVATCRGRGGGVGTLWFQPYSHLVLGECSGEDGFAQELWRGPAVQLLHFHWHLMQLLNFLCFVRWSLLPPLNNLLSRIIRSAPGDREICELCFSTGSEQNAPFLNQFDYI